MKTIFSRLCLLLSIMLPRFVHPASIDSLQGSYTCLPQELKVLSLLDGAIALETNMIKRAYKTDVDILDHNSLNLIKKLFHIISTTGHFSLSKKLDYKHLVQQLITNLVCLQIRNLTDPAFDISQFLVPLEKKQDAEPEMSSITFLTKSNPEIARLTLLAALWYFKSRISNFDYEKLLQETLVKTCKEILETNPSPEIKNRITKIREAADLIGKATTEIITTYKKFDYETTALEALKNLRGNKEYPEALEQTFQANISINKKKCSPFADCVETLLRNLINSIAYDKNAGEISIKNLPIEASKELVEFCKQYNHFELKSMPKAKNFTSNAEKKDFKQLTDQIIDFNNHSQKNKAAYNAWAELVSAIPGVWYVLQSTEDESPNYEIEPTFANLIIVTNHLLNHKWFPALTQHPQGENLHKFVQEYLPKFIELFGSTADDLEDFTDYGTLTINHANLYEFSIKLSKGHGYMEYLEEPINLPYLSKDELQEYPSLWLLQNVQQWQELPEHIFYLFAQSIDNPNFIRELPEKLHKITYPWYTVINQLINGRLNDTDLGLSKTKMLLSKKFINTEDFDNVSEETKANLITTSVNLVIKNMNNSTLTNLANELLDTLFKKGLINEEAIKTVINALKSKKTNNIAVLKTLKTLISHNQAYREATQTALKIGTQSTEKDERNAAIETLQIVIEKDLAYDEIIADIITIAQTDNEEILERLFSLLKALLKKEQGFNLVSRIAQKILEEIQEAATIKKTLLLVNTLFLSGKTIEKTLITTAVTAANKAINSENLFALEEALELFQTPLIKNNPAYTDDMIKAAVKGLRHSGQDCAINLSLSLIKKKEGINQLADAALECLEKETNNTYRIENLLKLFYKIIEQNQGYEQAVTAAATIFNVKNRELRTKAIYFLFTLIQEGKGHNEAIKIIQKINQTPSLFIHKREAASLSSLLENRQNQ